MVESVPRLAAFIAVAEERHFGRAAERLHLSQPSVSGRVARLEAELGLALLTRTSRSVTLTGAGLTLLPLARDVVRAAETLGRAAEAERWAASSPLRIGFTGSAAGELLPEALKRLRAHWPELPVTLRELTDERYDLLRQGELDIVLGRLLPEEAPDLDVLVLREEPRVVALWDGHPLAVRGTVRMADLGDDGFITQPAHVNPEFRAAWLAEQRRHGLPGRITGEASSVQEFLNLTATGRGICLVPASAARFNPWPGVTYLPVEDGATSALSVALRRDDRRRESVAFREAVAEVGAVLPVVPEPPR